MLAISAREAFATTVLMPLLIGIAWWWAPLAVCVGVFHTRLSVSDVSGAARGDWRERVCVHDARGERLASRQVGAEMLSRFAAGSSVLRDADHGVLSGGSVPRRRPRDPGSGESFVGCDDVRRRSLGKPHGAAVPRHASCMACATCCVRGEWHRGGGRCAVVCVRDVFSASSRAHSTPGFCTRTG